MGRVNEWMVVDTARMKHSKRRAVERCHTELILRCTRMVLPRLAEGKKTLVQRLVLLQQVAQLL